MKCAFTLSSENAALTKGIVCTLIEAVPSSWIFTWGSLAAPRAVRTADPQGLGQTRFLFASSINCMIELTDPKPGQSPDYFGILIEGKRPGKVQFGKSFTSVEVMPLSQSKRFASYFIGLDYRGRMTFAGPETNARENARRIFDIYLPPEDVNNSNLVVTIGADNGDENDAEIRALIALCKELKFQEQPQSQAIAR